MMTIKRVKFMVAHNTAPVLDNNDLPGLVQDSSQDNELPNLVRDSSQESELPNLLRRRMKCKTAHGNRLPGRDCKSTGEIAFQSQLSLESSKSHINISDMQKREEKFGEMLSEPCPKAFPLQAAPLLRWRAAAKIQGILGKFRKRKAPTDASACKEEISPSLVPECSHNTWVHHWPEEPDAPSHEDLEALTQLEPMLLEQHGSMVAAHRFITNRQVLKNPSSADAGFSKREFRIALLLKCSKEAATFSCDRLEQMFDRLLSLLRKRDGDITKAEFLRFPELLSREKALHARLQGNEDEQLLLGSRLRERLVGPIQSSEEALELLQKVAVAIEIEPCRTTNLLFQIGNSSSSSDGLPSGLASAIGNVMKIVHEFGAPNTGVKHDVLIAGWTLCNALAKQVIALGALPVATSPPSSAEKNEKLSKTAGVPSRLGKKYQSKVVRPEPKADVGVPSASNDGNGQSYEHECSVAFWQALSIGEVLWNVGCGAEVLNDEDFKTILQTSWGLFDSFDAVSCLLGPVGWGRLRPRLDALAALSLQPHVLSRDPAHAQSQLQNAGTLLQQIASMCEADPRLARIAALFGASFIADRVRSTANGSVDLIHGTAASAAAQVNRSAAAVTAELSQHVEELLGGREVQCCLSSGHFAIVAATPTKANPLAEWQQSVTANALANAKVKVESEEMILAPFGKFLRGYNDLQ